MFAMMYDTCRRHSVCAFVALDVCMLPVLTDVNSVQHSSRETCRDALPQTDVCASSIIQQLHCVPAYFSTLSRVECDLNV
jgi:hypothetical protein